MRARFSLPSLLLYTCVLSSVVRSGPRSDRWFVLAVYSYSIPLSATPSRIGLCKREKKRCQRHQRAGANTSISLCLASGDLDWIPCWWETQQWVTGHCFFYFFFFTCSMWYIIYGGHQWLNSTFKYFKQWGYFCREIDILYKIVSGLSSPSLKKYIFKSLHKKTKKQ